MLMLPKYLQQFLQKKMHTLNLIHMMKLYYLLVFLLIK